MRCPLCRWEKNHDGNCPETIPSGQQTRKREAIRENREGYGDGRTGLEMKPGAAPRIDSAVAAVSSPSRKPRMVMIHDSASKEHQMEIIND